MTKQKVLITVTTYPLPSRSYDELVCTAGILENGQWIRIYPVPLQFLIGLRKMESLKPLNIIGLNWNLKNEPMIFALKLFTFQPWISGYGSSWHNRY